MFISTISHSCITRLTYLSCPWKPLMPGRPISDCFALKTIAIRACAECLK